jgi:hypothetical protein
VSYGIVLRREKVLLLQSNNAGIYLSPLGVFWLILSSAAQGGEQLPRQSRLQNFQSAQKKRFSEGKITDIIFKLEGATHMQLTNFDGNSRPVLSS